MVTTLTLACMISYQTISTDLLQVKVGLTPDQYGYTALIITLFLGLGGLFNSKSIAKYGQKNYTIWVAIFLFLQVLSIL